MEILINMLMQNSDRQRQWGQRSFELLSEGVDQKLSNSLEQYWSRESILNMPFLATTCGGSFSKHLMESSCQ